MPARLTDPLIDRLYARIDRGDQDVCWPFVRKWVIEGYGMITVSPRRYERAHRLSYELHIGPIPADAILHHTCHNKLCCNPAHLQLTTRERHRPDHHPEHRREVCPNGHPLTADNLVPSRLKNGERVCLMCQRARVLHQYYKDKDKWRERQRASDARLTYEERRERNRRYQATHKAKKRAQGQT